MKIKYNATATTSDLTANGYNKSGDWIYVGSPATAVTKEHHHPRLSA